MASLKLNAFYNTALNVLKVIFPLITAPYVSRVLTPDGLGLANFSFMYASYFSMFAALGIPTYGIREVAKLRDDRESLTRLMSELISILLITTFIASTIYIITVFSVDKLSSDALIYIFAGLGLYLTPLGIDWYYSGLEKFGYITLRSLIIKVLSIICLFLFVKSRQDVIIYVIINVASSVLSNVWNYGKLLSSGIKPSFVTKGLKKHFKPVLILFASAVAVSIYTVLDTIMLGFMKGNSEVAYYNCASNISKMILAVLTSLSAVTMPRIAFYAKAKALDEISELSNKSFSFVSFLAIPAAFGLCCIAPVFAPLFYGDQYGGVVLPLQIMSFVILAIGLNNLSGIQLLIGMGEDKLFLKSIIAGAVTNLILNIILIPRYGAAGASFSSVLAESLILVITMILVRKKLHIMINKWVDCAKSLLVSLLFVPLFMIERQWCDGWLLVAVFVISGFVLYMVAELAIRNSAYAMFKNAIRNSLIKNGIIKDA